MAEEKNEVIEEKEDVIQEPEKTFTQSELDAIIKRRTGKAENSAIKGLGFDTLEEAAAFIAEGRKKKESEMSEAEKSRAENEALTGKLTDAEKRALKAETKAAALELGARTDRLTDILKLLPEGEEPIEDRMKAFLNERPEYLKKSGKGFSEETKTQQIPDEEAAKERIRKQMGL